MEDKYIVFALENRVYVEGYIVKQIVPEVKVLAEFDVLEGNYETVYRRL